MEKLRFIVTGDPPADYYYKSPKKLALIDGGSSKFNCLLGLAYLGNPTAVIGTVNSNIIGQMILAGFKREYVDTSDIKIIDMPQSRIYHLSSLENGHFSSSKICPICGNATWYEKSFTTNQYCISKIKSNDVIIFDHLTPQDIELISILPNDKIIDLGHVRRTLSPQNILSLIGKFEIIQMNGRVAMYLKDLFNLRNYRDFYDILKPKILIITWGKNGAEIVVSSSCSYGKILRNAVLDAVDTTGAGDAFLASFVNQYYKNDKEITKRFVDTAFEEASKTASFVVQSAGARGHIYAGFSPELKPGLCSCKDLAGFH